MSKTLKILLIIGIVALIITGALIIINNYRINKLPHDIATSSSKDGNYSLSFQQIGDAEFPFGKTKVRVTLFNGDTKISVYDGEINNDGKNADENNFAADWQPDLVWVTLTGEEQKPLYVLMAFNGHISTYE